MTKSAFLLGTACALVLATLARAQVSDGGQTPIAIQEISKQGQAAGSGAAMAKKIPLKSTYAASHISRSEIEQSSPVATAQTILNKEPSINATSAGPLGVEQNITFRAFNSAEFSETYDNIALNDVFNGGVTNEASAKDDVLVTKNDFDSIDLYRGINNPSVNSYNSLAGTINYNSRKPSDQFGGEVGLTYGSFDTLQYHATLNTGTIDGLSQLLSFERETSNGWLDYNKDRNNNLYYAFNQQTGGTGKIYGNFIYDQNSGEEAYDEPQLLINEFGKSYQAPLSEYNEPLQDTDYQVILGTTQAITDITTFDVKGFFGTNDFSRNAFSNPLDQKTGFYVPNSDVAHTSTTFYGYTGNTIGLQPSFTIDLPYNTVQLGANYTLGHLHSREYYGDQDPVVQIPGVNDIWDEHDVRTLYSVYLQDEIDLLDDKLKITPGVKYLYANTKDTDDLGYYYSVAGSVSDTAHYTSPTLGASYEFLPNTVLYAAYGQNVEFPTIDAFYDNISVGPDYTAIEPVHLEPEHVADYEAGLRYAAPAQGFNSALGFYLENFTDTFITATDPATGISTTMNGGSSRYKGIELQLAEDFGHQMMRQTDLGDFTGYLNYSYNNAIFTSNFDISSVGNNGASLSEVTKGQPVALVPEDTVNFGGTWALDGWGATADARYVTSQYVNQDDAGTPSDLKEPAYFVLNLELSKTIPVRLGPANAVKFTLDADNVLNRTYDAYAYGETYTKYAPAALAGKPYASVQEAAPQAFYGSVTLLF